MHTHSVNYIDECYRRILEFAASIKATFEPVIQTHLYPRSQIDIYIQVLEQDGGKYSPVCMLFIGITFITSRRASDLHKCDDVGANKCRRSYV